MVSIGLRQSYRWGNVVEREKQRDREREGRKGRVNFISAHKSTAGCHDPGLCLHGNGSCYNLLLLSLSLFHPSHVFPLILFLLTVIHFLSLPFAFLLLPFLSSLTLYKTDRKKERICVFFPQSIFCCFLINCHF